MTTQLWLIAAFALIGLVDTIYLIRHVLTGEPVACWFFPKEWCRKVQSSKYSRTFGIPNPVAGFVMYVIILGLLWQYNQGAVPFSWLQAVIAFGFAFSLYFTYIQAFVLRAFCTWCVVSAINFLVMFSAALLL